MLISTKYLIHLFQTAIFSLLIIAKFSLALSVDHQNTLFFEETTAVSSTPSIPVQHQTLCNQTDERVKATCIEVTTRFPNRYTTVVEHNETWWSLAKTINADKPNTLHLITSNITLANPLHVTADNVAIIGVKNQEEKNRISLSKTLYNQIDTFISSTGDHLLVENLEFEPRGHLTHHLFHVINHFFVLSGQHSKLRNIDFHGAEATAKSLIFAHDADTLQVDRLHVRGESSGISAFIHTERVNDIDLSNIYGDSACAACTSFLMLDSKRLTCRNINLSLKTSLDDAPDAPVGISIINSQPVSDIFINLSNITLSPGIPSEKLEKPVIIATRAKTKVHLSLIDNSFNHEGIASNLNFSDTSFSNTTAEPTDTINDTLPYTEAYDDIVWQSFLPGCLTHQLYPETAGDLPTEITFATDSATRSVSRSSGNTFITRNVISTKPDTLNNYSEEHLYDLNPNDSESAGNFAAAFIGGTAAVSATLTYLGSFAMCAVFHKRAACKVFNTLTCKLAEHKSWNWYSPTISSDDSTAKMLSADSESPL